MGNDIPAKPTSSPAARASDPAPAVFATPYQPYGHPVAATRSTVPASVSLVLVGGILAVIGSSIPWSRLSTMSGAYSFDGVDSPDGIATLVGGLVATVTAFAVVIVGSVLGLHIVAALAGIGLIGVAAWDIGAIFLRRDDLQSMATAEGDPYGLGGAASLQVGVGLWMVLCAGIAIVVGSTLAAIKGGPPR